MPLQAIYETLSALLREQFDDDSLVARPDLTADDVAGWDSFAHIRLMLAVEQAFNVSFTAGQMASLRNVGDLAALIASKVQP
jgi:acyl carrier protein